MQKLVTPHVSHISHLSVVHLLQEGAHPGDQVPFWCRGRPTARSCPYRRCETPGAPADKAEGLPEEAVSGSPGI